jgi:6-pyruvoyltetrahydropterin/6-carboxytetrahydropterin synthase
MTAVAYSTRRCTFSAGHRYYVDAWSPGENERVFGRLRTSHGHNYAVDVTVQGPIDRETGMVMDLAELKRILDETIVDRFDHADLNADPLFRGAVPTTENLALVIWDLLAPKLGTERLAQVRVWEDATLFVDYRGTSRGTSA